MKPNQHLTPDSKLPGPSPAGNLEENPGNLRSGEPSAALERAESGDDTSSDDSITRLVAALWLKNKPTLAERVALLRRVQMELHTSGSIPQDQVTEASSCAHKLAGLLGTYGFPHGTDCARSIEFMMSTGPLTAEANGNLDFLITELERIVAD